jgi:hypothetical protein
VFPIGKLKGMTIDLDGVRTVVDLKVIEIVYDTTPYATLLGLDWEFYNQDVINLKTQKMTLKSGKYRVVALQLGFHAPTILPPFHPSTTSACTCHILHRSLTGSAE